MYKDKIKYIADRYISEKKTQPLRPINAYHIQKAKRIALPFSAFYPEVRKRCKNH